MTLAAISGFASKQNEHAIKWSAPAFYGYSKSTASVVAGNTLYTNVSEGDAPLAVLASASAATATGTLTLSGKAISAYKHLQHTWQATYNDDSPIASAGEITDPNALAPINMYTDQIGGEAAFIFHEPGTYKITHALESANGTTDTVTATITVNVPTYAHKWFDPDNGSDANDGHDPHGFNITAGTYTNATKRIVLTGGDANKFSTYDHAAATSQTYLTDNYNWIALFYDAAWSWHRIAAKISDSEIELVNAIGADKTVASSDGPTETFDPATDVAADTAHHFKVNKTYEITTGIICEDTDGLRFMGWGGSGKYTLKAVANIARVINTAVGASDLAGNLINTHKMIIDCGNAEGFSSAPYGGGFSGSGDTGTISYIMDRCVTTNTDETGCVRIQGTSAVTVYWFAWDTEFESRKLRAEGKGSNVFASIKSPGISAIVGCRFRTGLVDSQTLDHHTYISGNHSHRLRLYNDFLEDIAGGTGYCFNENCGGPGDPASQYMLIFGNRFRNANNGIDGSNTSNNYDPVDGSTFQNTVIMRNSFDGTDGLKAGGIFWASTEDAFIAHNVAIVVTNEMMRLLNDQASNHFVLENNRSYNCEVCRLTTNVAGEYEVIGSITYRTETDDSVVSWDSVAIGTDTYFQDGQFYAPNDIDGNIYNDDGVYENLTTFNARANNSGNTESDPGWADPANGDFT